MRKISVITPTRQRSNYAYIFVKSVLEKAEHPDRVEMLFYLDKDDETIGNYEKLLGSFGQVRLIVSYPILIGQAWNILAYESTGEVIMMGNDDLEFVTEKWDTVVDVEADRFPDQIYAMSPIETWLGGQHAFNFPMVSRFWYETLGHFTPGIFPFWFNDRWIVDIAMRLNRAYPLNGFTVLHKQGTFSDSIRESSQWTRDNLDSTLYHNTHPWRDKEAAKLRPFLQSTAGDTDLHVISSWSSCK